MRHVVRGVSLTEDGGMVIEFITPGTDLRANGLLLQHALVVPPDDELLDLIEHVDETLQKALAEALALFEVAPVPEAVASEVPDESSPYDNPEERA